MKKYFNVLFAALILLTVSTFAQNNPIENTLLWRINKPGLKTSYLYGTMHVKDARAFDFADSVLLTRFFSDSTLMSSDSLIYVLAYMDSLNNTQVENNSNARIRSSKPLIYNTKNEQEDTVKVFKINCFPNPAFSELTVQSTAPIKGKITIVDNVGRIVMEQYFDSNHKIIDIRNLSFGIYVLNLIGSDGKMHNTKFIKQ